IGDRVGVVLVRIVRRGVAVGRAGERPPDRVDVPQRFAGARGAEAGGRVGHRVIGGDVGGAPARGGRLGAARPGGGRRRVGGRAVRGLVIDGRSVVGTEELVPGQTGARRLNALHALGCSNGAPIMLARRGWGRGRQVVLARGSVSHRAVRLSNRRATPRAPSS